MNIIQLLEEESGKIITIDNALINSQLYTTSEKILLLMLLSNNKSSIKILSDQIGTTKQTICRNLKRLEEKGVIKKNKRKDTNGSNISNEYIVYNYPEIWQAKTETELKEIIKKIESTANDK